MLRTSILLSFLVSFNSPAAAQPAAPLPKVVLVGDSIRLGYAPIVARKLEGMAIVSSPEPNGGDSANVLGNLDAWVLREKPDVVHFNAGLHDLKVARTSRRHQVALDEYEANLHEIVGRARAELF